MFDYVDRVQRLSREGFEAATAVPAALTREFEVAAEGQKNYSSKAFQDAQVYARKILGVRSFGEAVEAQTEFLNGARRDYWDRARQLNDFYFNLLEALAKPTEGFVEKISREVTVVSKGSS
ncbi:phasin family protein [Methylocystis bryophila]|uniref:Phasin domain-containing protein n=1 Tax=Methylocystis bryophila TaxID=655015 RepID=A0A1W6MQI2_9HYPH|nr:phasin family protein [Methylocystis bryophila]ARN79822.1 hypothetical protein B1812_00655 [Methylocystis bryophila]BDV39706.1 hypothetical protein DSM21852_29590 [Methylocystis bryophila]